MNRIRTQDVELSALQDNVVAALRPVEGCPLVTGRLVESVSLTAAASDVAHGLGRRLRGWILVRTNGTAAVYEPSVSTLPDRFVRLQAAAPVVVTLWVF